MDPEATICRAEHAAQEGDLEELVDALADYWSWRNAGGFEPARGDERAREARQLGNEWERMHENDERATRRARRERNR